MLFVAGTVIALAAAVAVPYLMAVRHRTEPSQATPVWLLPLVAPMVSAALGPLLVPHLPPGQARETLLLACFAMFGLSLLGTLLMLPLVFARLVTGGPLPLALTPTLFLVLGPLGQSTTAVGMFADVAPGVLPAPYSEGFGILAVLYGVPVMGFALLWSGLATAHVLRARRHGMGFTMTWWAFTFPVGTCVTGAEALARHTGLVVYEGLAIGLYGVLVGAWTIAAVRTAHGLLNGTLLAAPRPTPAPPRPLGRHDVGCRPLNGAPVRHARPAQRGAALSAAPNTRGASPNDGPYHVRCRPLTSAQGRPGKASGPSSAVKRYGSSGRTTTSGAAARRSSRGTRG